MKRLIYTLSLLLMTFIAMAQTNTFVGASPGVWNEARNWSLKQVPTFAHDVVIQGKTVSVDFNQSAVAKSVFVDARSYFEIKNNASLSIANSISKGLHNQGRTLIEGRLLIEDVIGSSSFNDHCILNDGFIHIGNNGWVSIDGSGGCGITISNKAELYNYGEIIIEDTNYGMRVRGLFENYDDVYLEPSQGHGLECRAGEVINAMGAEVRVEGSSFAILVMEDLITQIPGVFKNYGEVRAENMEWSGVSVRDGDFINYRGGQVRTFFSQQGCGISLGPNGEFKNYSSIESRYNELDGIRLQGLFTNYGNIFSSHNSRHGISLLTFPGFNQPGRFVNHNDVEIFDNDTSSIDAMRGLYHNLDKGITVHYNILRGDSIRNDGIWESFAPDLTHTATMDNYGVILDFYDAHGLTRNHQLIVDPVDGPLIQGVPINQALELVSTSNITIYDWYNQFTWGQRVGTYNVGNNRFTPNAVGDGEDLVYVDVRINSSGQRRRIMAMVDETSPLKRKDEAYSLKQVSVEDAEIISGDCVVYSANGVILQKGRADDGIPRWSDLAPGVYNCTCTDKEGRSTQERRWVY